MFHQDENRHRTNTDVCPIIMAWALQLGEDKAIIRLIMETIVPREALGGFDEILAKYIPRLGINLGNKQSNLEKLRPRSTHHLYCVLMKILEQKV